MSDLKASVQSQVIRSEDFFVGWVPVPAGYREVLQTATLLMFATACGLASLLPLRQQSPGAGVWDSNTTVSIEGVITAAPYALLHAPIDGPDDTLRTVLLVEEGKFGARERVTPFDGRRVRATGTFLHRDGRWMLELVAGDAGIRPVAELPARPAPVTIPVPQELGPVKLRGEIIDPKCYLGAMRPGGGKTHKACAALCISGGIPPMLVTRDQQNRETYYLLTTEDHQSANKLLLSLVGDSVELQGELTMVGDLRVVRVAIRGVRRL